MSFRLVALTPTIGASPGESVVGRVEVFNDGTVDAIYTITVVGLAADPLSEVAVPPPPRVAVAAGTSATADVVVVVPRTLGIGQHAAAFEATSSRSNDRAALTPFTVSIQSVARVELVPQPSTIRARRKAKFHLDVTNNEELPVEIALTGEAPDVAVSFTPPAMSLLPGQRVVARGDVKGPRHWSGERTQHNILITARGRASSTSVTAAYVQRPLFAHRFRMVLAAVTVVAVWLAAIGGVALWLSNRDDGTEASVELVGVDTNGDGIPDAFFDADGNPVTATDTDGDGIPDSFIDADGNPITGIDTNGDGIPDTLVDADGNPLTAIDTNGDGKPDTLSNGAPLPGTDEEVSAPEPQATILRGTVEIDGDPSTVAVALTPIELGAPASPEAAPIGLRAAQPSEQTGKIWSARTTTLNDIVGSPTRRTVAIEPDSTVPGADGVWLFTDVLQGQSYEVSFSSPGYDTQSFVLTPRADGEPIDLDVTMKPANGSLSGSVVGPSGSLGGAEVRITDGTLEFVTTSASGTGAWSLQGVSTPGVYTVTATLRGYSTAVRQVRLAPGDKPSGLSLQMAPGLGSITGVVTSNAAGLGGVTVTASNGETTLTTTTLTEGNIGFYSLPQLGVPADYTVQAELDGYVTNSRRVPLNGSLGGVDFSMTSTTSTLAGRVVSSAGGGIESAGLIVSTGDLQFRASTSPTGAFQIDRLPPGDYTITVEHFQHDSVTEFTTLTAGATPTPLTITLPLSTGPPAVGTGSLVVSAINEDSTIVPAGINNAKVTISRNRSADIRVLQDPDASAVTFEDLPIGTWTINVTAAGYNVSAPVTRSVGQTRERAEIRLQKLGSASGIMVNSLDPAKTPLTGYAVNLFRLQTDTDTVGVPAGSFVANAAGTWTTPPAALATGVYRIQATSPLGFLVRNDQILDTSPEVRGRTMAFLVPTLTDAEVKPLEIPAIQADPYPTITGKIYKPRLNGVTVEYDALDDSTLTVTGVCNGKPVPAADIKVTDAFGNSNPPTQDLLDTFSMSPSAVAALIPTNELPGNCQFSVAASGRVGRTIEFTNILASNGSVASDRLAAAAMVKTPAPLTGTVFWFDKGTSPDERRPLGNVAIATAAPVITGFATGEASAAIPDPRPIAQVGPLSTTGNATTGAWTLNGQVFGTSNYVFTTPNFTPGTVPVTINETNRVVASGANANVLTEPIDGSGFGIELTPPSPGTISGKVTIQTSTTPKYGTNMVNGTDPAGTVREATPNAATGDYSFAAAIAGTWSIGFDALANHVREPAGTTTPPFVGRLEPGGSISGVNATFTELATVRIRLFDKSSPSTPITLPVGLDLTAPAAPPLTGPVVDRPVSAPNGANVYELAGIPVAASAPTSTPVDYRLALQLADFDLSTARTGPLLTDPIVDARNLALPMVAGRVTDIDLYIDSFKSITGSIRGLQTVGAAIDLPLSGPADLAAVRVGAVAGEAAPKIEAGPTPGSFVVTGLPGTYQLTPSHPEYQNFPTQLVDLGASTGTAVGPYDLTLLPSKLSVDALTQLVGGTDVAGAVFDRYLGTAPCANFPAVPVRTNIATVGPTVIDIAPGNYCLRISKFDSVSGAEIAFPAIVAVTVPNSTKGAAPSVATVIAPLPALRPTLTGTLVAKNTIGGTVELVAAPAPVLTNAFTQNVDVSVNGSTTANLNPNSTGNRSATAVAPPAVVPPAVQTEFAWTYQFTNVPYGENKITAPRIDGYTPDSTTTQTVVVVDNFGPTAVPEFVYTLANSSVEIALGPGTFPSLDTAFASTDARAVVSFVSRTGAGAGPRSYAFNAATNTLTIADVSPENGDWTLSFDDALHAAFTDNKVKISQLLNPNGSRTATLKTDPVGDLTRLTGLATEQAGAAAPVALSGDALLTLVGPTTYTLTPTPPPANSGGAKLSGSTYIFDVAPGTYTLTATKSDFLPQQLTSRNLTVAGTMLAGQNIAIQKQATITVTASNRGLAIPPNVRVELLNTGNSSTYGPTDLSSATTNPTATFIVPAGTYRARTTTLDTTYPQQTSSPDKSVAVGAAVPFDITLPRITRFAVTDGTVPIAATVTIPTLAPKSAPAGTTIEFSETSTTGALSATVSGTGFRTKVVPVAAQLLTTNPVTLLGNVTVSGTITGAANGPITAVNAANAADMKTGSITGGAYTIPGLTNNADGTAKTWNISYTEVGVGTGSTSVVVSDTSAVAETGKNITLDPRPVNYNFTVTTAGSTAVPGAAVTITPAPTTAPPDTNAQGKTTAIVSESVAFGWTVKKAGYLTRYGSITKAASHPDVAVSVSMVAGVNGRVRDGASGVNSATVVVCPPDSTAACTPVAPDRTFGSTTSEGLFTITSDLLPGTYKVWATAPGGGKTGSSTLTIAANGDASLVPSDIAIS